MIWVKENGVRVDLHDCVLCGMPARLVTVDGKIIELLIKKPVPRIYLPASIGRRMFVLVGRSSLGNFYYEETRPIKKEGEAPEQARASNDARLKSAR